MKGKHKLGDRLTVAEVRVIREFVKDGPTNAQLAKRLYLSEQCIKFHMQGLMAKSGTLTRTGLALWWIRKAQYKYAIEDQFRSRREIARTRPWENS